MSPLGDLIAATHGVAAGEAHDRSVLTAEDQDALVRTGREVLTVFPPMPAACVMMSALFAGRFHSTTGVPVYVVAGSLDIGASRIFGGDAQINGAQRFSRPDSSWDGHAWVALGSVVVDVSIFRTAYSRESPVLLAQFVRRLFGEGRGLLIDKQASLKRSGLAYRPQYVLSEAQVAGLIAGAMTIVRR